MICLLNNHDPVDFKDREKLGIRIKYAKRLISKARGPAKVNPKLVIDAFLKNPSCCFCGMTEIVREQDFYNSNIPKVVTDESNKLLYISRAPIPTTKDSKFLAAKRQVCIYGFTEESLNEYGPNSKKTHNENIEDIEILRLLEKGYEIRMVDVSGSSIAVDTPEDLERVRNHINGL